MKSASPLAAALRPAARATLAIALAAPALHTQASDASCQQRSSVSAVPVIELYTSEGCNSCPPADRWLSRWKAQPDAVALAFHVDYWDRLGWRDRYGSPAYTQRQAQQQASNGARFSYTPQVVVDGADRKDWPAVQQGGHAEARPAAKVALALTREADGYRADITPLPGAPARLAAYWAVTEDGHRSAVQAGENAGVTLQHDFVVRQYQPVPAWAVAAGASNALRFNPAAGEPGHPRHVNLVVVDAVSGRPLQAIKLGC